MSYYAGAITLLSSREFDGGLVLKYQTDHPSKTVQLYLSGELAAWQKPAQGVATFTVHDLRHTDITFALAVDDDSAEINYWDDAFGTASDYGNRMRIRTPQTIVPYRPDDVWTVYRGNAGDGEATIQVHQQPFYTGGRRAGGFGAGFGQGGFGFDAYDCKGFGYNFSHGEFGFDCAMLEWESEPLPPGTYPYKVTVTDAAGNESTATSGTITLNTYARPARSLSVESYNQGTDALELSFTASEDI